MLMRLGNTVFWIGIFCALTSCTSAPHSSTSPADLPDFAKPTAQVFSRGGYDVRDPILYRSLTRADFRANSPPASVAEHAARMGAYTCGLLIPGENQQLDLSYDAAAESYAARVMHFEVNAVMDPDCSWWNPRETGLPPEYILQHEQIHFALVEISARELARRLRTLEARADSAGSASSALQRKIRSAFEDSVADIVEDNTKFDRDTSGRYEPRKQARWLADVEKRLRLVPASPERRADEGPQPQTQPDWEPL